MKAESRVGNEILIKTGKSYLVEEKAPLRSLDIFKGLVKQGLLGVLISRAHPETLKTEHDLKNVSDLHWLTTTSGRNTISPVNINIFAKHLMDLTSKKNSVVLFIGMEYILGLHEFKTILNAMRAIKDQVVISSSVLIVSIDSNAMGGNDLKNIKKEFITIGEDDKVTVGSQVILRPVESHEGSIKKFLDLILKENPDIVYDPHDGSYSPKLRQSLRLKREAFEVLLEKIAKIGLLKKSFWGNIPLCPPHRASDLKLKALCMYCGSGEFEKGVGIEHLDCGHLDRKENFVGDTCPKCGDKIRQIGVDYRSISNYYICNHCGEYFGGPVLKFQCVEHGELFEINEALWKKAYLYSKGDLPAEELVKLSERALDELLEK